MTEIVAKTQAAVVQGQQVTVQRVFSPTVTDADIGLLRQDIRGNENGGDWTEYVVVGYRGAEVLADLQTLRRRLA